MSSQASAIASSRPLSEVELVRLAPVTWVPMPELSPTHEFSTLGAVSRHAGRGNSVPCRNVALVPADRTEPSCKDVCPRPRRRRRQKIKEVFEQVLSSFSLHCF